MLKVQHDCNNLFCGHDIDFCSSQDFTCRLPCIISVFLDKLLSYFTEKRHFSLRFVSFLSCVMKARDDAVIPEPVLDLLSSILKALD